MENVQVIEGYLFRFESGSGHQHGRALHQVKCPVGAVTRSSRWYTTAARLPHRADTAYVKAMKNAEGVVTGHRVIWRWGGSRTRSSAGWNALPLKEGREAAELVPGRRQRCGPAVAPRWVKGQGRVTAPVEDEVQYRFQMCSAESEKHRTGAEERYRDACAGELERGPPPRISDTGYAARGSVVGVDRKQFS